MANKAKPLHRQYGNAAPPNKERPQCDGKRRDYEQKLKRCVNDAFPVRVTGSLDAHYKNLCLGCVAETRKAGWKVTFQLEGDAALLPE